jgi:hypothetical protein
VKVVRMALLAGALAFATLGFTSGGVAAYGKADQPLAQLTFSGNCDNPSFPFCAPPPAGVGLGGIWTWVEVDANGTGDATGAVCGHNIAGPRGGADSLRGDITWWWSQTPQGFPVAMGAPLDPNGYYNVAISGVGVFAWPVTQGHYSAHPVPGVSLQATVAP